MLQELSIHNFAIIQSLEVSFSNGMTVLTGETGAGKSIIIDAVGLLAGGRGSTDFIRQGEAKCKLEAQFAFSPTNKLIDLLNELDIEFEDNSLIISREIHSNGKNVCRVNGSLVNTTILRQIGSYLVDIHGQNEHQELMQSEHHLELLDTYGYNNIHPLLETYQTHYNEFISVQKKLKSQNQDAQEMIQRLDMLTFQIKEIEEAHLISGEEEQLTEEKHKLTNFKKIADALSIAYNALSNNDTGTIDALGTAMNELQSIANFSNEYTTLFENTQTAYYLLQDTESDLSRILDSLEMDEQRLDEVELRLDTIRQLKRKYGDSIDLILEYYTTISEELEQLNAQDESNEELENRLAQLEVQTRKTATKLHDERKKAAKSLEKAIHEQLNALYMEKAEFSVHFSDINDMTSFNPKGIDTIEFYLSANPGEALKPLVKVASGGELSRIMLALKTVFSESEGITSIIFDEVDTGVSGRVAQSIADKIHQIAEHSQVLCITHLPQVAAVADTQYFIEKEVKGDRTKTSLRILTYDERIQEIARMLAGSEITPLTLEHAKELLDLASET